MRLRNFAKFEKQMVTSSKVLSFADPFPYQAAIRAADLELLPTSKGKFRAELTQITLNRLWMQQGHESLPRVLVGTVDPSRRVIGFLTGANDPAMAHCGLSVSPRDIIINSTDALHRRTEAACNWGSMSLPLDDFDAVCKSLTGHEFPNDTATHLVRPGPVLMSQLLNAHASVAQIARTIPDILASPEVARALEDKLTHLMVRCLTDGTSVDRSAGCRRRDRVVAQFEEYLEANQGRALNLAEICTAIGVAERTLRAACEEHLGMGPIRYLTLRRMHLVRRALLRADYSETSVTRIATDHGFWELGHFAVAYRALFGEAPSESLRQPLGYCKFPDRPLSSSDSYFA
jgi:AraC-like DNA-binding protein